MSAASRTGLPPAPCRRSDRTAESLPNLPALFYSPCVDRAIVPNLLHRLKRLVSTGRAAAAQPGVAISPRGDLCATCSTTTRTGTTGSRGCAASCSISIRASTSACTRRKTWGRELYERFTVFMDRFHVAGWRRWYCVEPLSEGADARHRRPDADAGARDPGLPRDLRRRLAEEVRARRHLPRPLRQRDRPARHPAQRRDPARRVPRPPDQGGARHRGPALLRAFRHRHPRHCSAPC